MPAAEEQKLSARLAEVERSTKHQFVVVSVKSLGGHDIADYGVTLGRFWGVGRAEADDGVILLVAPHERKARIEVGYGLEASLKDEEAAEIMHEAILPQFRRGKMAEGIFAGSEAIIKEITP